MSENSVQLTFERIQVLEILNTDRAAADLVLIGRADASLRGANLTSASGVFAHFVEFTMKR